MVAEKEELVQEGSGEPLGEIDYILVSGRTAAGELSPGHTVLVGEGGGGGDRWGVVLPRGHLDRSAPPHSIRV